MHVPALFGQVATLVVEPSAYLFHVLQPAADSCQCNYPPQVVAGKQSNFLHEREYACPVSIEAFARGRGKYNQRALMCTPSAEPICVILRPRKLARPVASFGKPLLGGEPLRPVQPGPVQLESAEVRVRDHVGWKPTTWSADAPSSGGVCNPSLSSVNTLAIRRASDASKAVVSVFGLAADRRHPGHAIGLDHATAQRQPARKGHAKASGEAPATMAATARAPAPPIA